MPGHNLFFSVSRDVKEPADEGSQESREGNEANEGATVESSLDVLFGVVDNVQQPDVMHFDVPVQTLKQCDGVGNGMECRYGRNI